MMRLRNYSFYFTVFFLLVVLVTPVLFPTPAYAQQGGLTGQAPQTLGQAVGQAAGEAATCWGANFGAAALKSILGSLASTLTGAPSRILSSAVSQSVPVHDSAGSSAITGGQQTVSIAEGAQSCMRDVVAKIFLDWMTDQTVAWIQNGGRPQFVTNWDNFAKDAVNVAVGEVVNNTTLGFVCSPFRAQLQAAFFPVTTTQHPIQCTLDDIVANVQDFWDDWRNGGWVAYNKMWQPENNYFGVYLMMRDDALLTALERKDAKVAEAVAGKGFLSTKRCRGGGVSPDGYDPALLSDLEGSGYVRDTLGNLCSPEDLEIETPGDTVGALAAQAFTSDVQWAANIQSSLAAIVNAAMNRLTQGFIGSLTNRNGRGGSLSGRSLYSNTGDFSADNGNTLSADQIRNLTRVGGLSDALSLIQNILNRTGAVSVLKQRSLSTVDSTIFILEQAPLNSSCRSGPFGGYNFSTNRVSATDNQTRLQAELDDITSLEQGLGGFDASLRAATSPAQISSQLESLQTFLDLHIAGLGAVVPEDALSRAEQEVYGTYQQFSDVHGRFQQCSSYQAPFYIPPTIAAPAPTSTTTGLPLRTVRVDTRDVTQFGHYFSTYDDFRESPDQFCTELAQYPNGALSDTSFSCVAQDRFDPPTLDYRVNGSWGSSVGIQGRGFCPGRQYVEWVECVY